MTKDLAYFWCIAYRRHYWIPTEGEAGVAGGAKVIRWQLSCEHCDSIAVEWRDMFGARLPGTQRQYDLGSGYKRARAELSPEEAFLLLVKEQGTRVPEHVKPTYTKRNFA